jgi:hypothetical protein
MKSTLISIALVIATLFLLIMAATNFVVFTTSLIFIAAIIGSAEFLSQLEFAVSHYN